MSQLSMHPRLKEIIQQFELESLSDSQWPALIAQLNHLFNEAYDPTTIDYTNFIKLAFEGNFTLDTRGNILSCSVDFEAALNWPKKLIDQSFSSLLVESDVHKFQQGLKRAHHDITRLELQLQHANPAIIEVFLAPYPSKKGTPSRIFGVIRHLEHKVDTKELERSFQSHMIELEWAKSNLEKVNKQLQHLAFHDSLTGIANRSLFITKLKKALDKAQENDLSYAVLFLDFDRFKHINDSLGHSIGDELLIEISKRLLTCVRPKDTVARLGGDEFTILFENIQNIAEVKIVASRIQEELSKPFSLIGQTIHMTMSIGIVLHDKSYKTPSDVLRDADFAMYRAKADGGARFQIFDQTMRDRALKLIHIERDLRQALKQRELSAHYQPIMELSTGKLIGFEALLRWYRPEHGLVYPGDFIQIAEESGLIIEFDYWLLEHACKQMLALQKKSQNTLLNLNVNFSSRQLSYPEVSKRTKEILQKTGFPANKLRLEITEAMLIEDTNLAQSLLNDLKSLGVKLNIDDFGTGYSSLSYLQSLPIDILKIDKSFIRHLHTKRESFELVKTMITMAHALGMKVVAEGVEENPQVHHLRTLGCDYTQGYLISKPLKQELLTTFIKRVNQKEFASLFSL